MPKHSNLLIQFIFFITDSGQPTSLALSQVSNQRVQATWVFPANFPQATYRVYINTEDVNNGGIEVSEGTTYTTGTFAADSNVTVIVRSTTGTYLSVPSAPASLVIVGKEFKYIDILATNVKKDCKLNFYL